MRCSIFRFFFFFFCKGNVNSLSLTCSDSGRIEINHKEDAKRKKRGSFFLPPLSFQGAPLSLLLSLVFLSFSSSPPQPPLSSIP